MMSTSAPLLLLLLLLGCQASLATAAGPRLELPTIYYDNMVFQRVSHSRSVPSRSQSYIIALTAT